jgi:predicted RNA-binding protein (virulence factor B family)
MKTLVCSLAAILSVALSSTVLAEERTYTEKITGTVISVDKQGLIVIDTGKGRVEILLVDDVKEPKVGEKVTAHCWYHNRGRYSTDKIEKLGDAKGGSKKR